MKKREFAEFLENEIDRWHDGPIPLELHQHLRMSWEEYCTWTKSDKLPIGMMERWGIKED